MSKACSLTGKRVMRGNNVSHAHNKTRRSFEPNLQSVRLYSSALKRNVRLRIATSTLRTIDKKGGLDEFLLGYRSAKLAEKAKKLKRDVLKSLAKNKTNDATNDTTNDTLGDHPSDEGNVSLVPAEQAQT